MELGLIIGLSIAGALLFLLIIFLAAGYTKAPTDTAVIITGPRRQRVLVGKAGFRIPFFERVDKLSLSLMSIDIKTRNSVPTNEFINVNVDAVANIKIGSTPEMLQRAAESFDALCTYGVHRQRKDSGRNSRARQADSGHATCSAQRKVDGTLHMRESCRIN